MTLQQLHNTTEDNITTALDGALPGGIDSIGSPAMAASEAPMAQGARGVPLSVHVKAMLENYFRDLDGHAPAGLYQMVLQEVEQPLLQTVLNYTRGNQSKAAAMLGLNRGTLRKKLRQYDIS